MLLFLRLNQEFRQILRIQGSQVQKSIHAPKQMKLNRSSGESIRIEADQVSNPLFLHRSHASAVSTSWI
jgi:hypothetical protein